MECAFLLCSPMFMGCACVCVCVGVCNERCLLFSTSDPREWTLGIFLCKCSTPNASGQHSPQRSSSSVHFVHLPSVVCGQLRSIVQMGFLRVPHARALMCILCRCCNFWNALCSFKPKIRCQGQHCFNKTCPI